MNPFDLILAPFAALGSYKQAKKSNSLEQQALGMQRQQLQHQQGISDSVMPLYYNGLNFLSRRAGLGAFDPNGSGSYDPTMGPPPGQPGGPGPMSTPVYSAPPAMQYGTPLSYAANPYTPLKGKGDSAFIDGGGTNTSVGDPNGDLPSPNPQMMMQMMRGSGMDPGMVPSFRLNEYNPMSPMHLSPMAFYSMMLSQGDQQTPTQQSYKPDTGQGDPGGMPPVNPALAMRQSMRQGAQQQQNPSTPPPVAPTPRATPGMGAPILQRPDLNGGNPFAGYGSRKTLPGVHQVMPPPGQSGSQNGSPYLGGPALTGGVNNQQLGVYNDPADALRNAQAQDDINHQLSIQEDQLKHNLGERGLVDSSVYGGALSQLQNNALDQYANFRRNLAINAGNEQAQRVQQMMSALNPAFGLMPSTMSGANAYAGTTNLQNMQSQQALNNLMSQMGQWFGGQPGQSGSGGPGPNYNGPWNFFG